VADAFCHGLILFVFAVAEPILGSKFVSILQDHKGSVKTKWHSDVAEHSIDYVSGGKKHVMYYPTPQSLLKRVQVCSAGALGMQASHCLFRCSRRWAWGFPSGRLAKVRRKRGKRAK
jgi:hypothetical protein